MNNMEIFKTKLIELHKDACHRRCESDISIMDMCRITIDELSSYETIIKEFFSNNGAADGIRKIYSGVKESVDKKNKQISCIDMNSVYKIYKEYYDGMVEFVKDIIKIHNSENCNYGQEICDKLKRAEECDHKFIHSLFDDETNHEEMTELSEALKNIEFLIDFIPQLHEMKDNCNTICNMIEGKNDEEVECLTKDSLKLLFNSISEYSHESIEEVVKIYSKIYCILFEGCENKQEIRYVLF